MEYTEKDIIKLFDRYPDGVKNLYGKVTYGKGQFETRYNIFTQGILDGFDFANAMLSGGSLYLMLDVDVSEDELPLYNSDLDLFILKTGDVENTVVKLEKVLQHFADYAVKSGVEILYIIRGLLIEVLIAGKRRVQILLSQYSSIPNCLGNLSVVHLHLYYDGDLYMSEAALDNIIRKETQMSRAPIKDVKIPQLISRGVTPVGDILVTRMETEFHKVLYDLDELKTRLDECTIDGDYIQNNVGSLVIARDISTVVDRCRVLMEGKWNAKRMSYMRDLKISQDIDVFDLNIRLPAPEILYRCVFIRANEGSKKRRVLKIKTMMGTESPAVIVEKNLTLLKDICWYPDKQDVVHFEVEKSNNLKFLERYFKRQCVFRFIRDVSHVMNTDGTISETTDMRKGDKINTTFMLVTYDALESLMFFDVVEIGERAVPL